MYNIKIIHIFVLDYYFYQTRATSATRTVFRLNTN